MVIDSHYNRRKIAIRSITKEFSIISVLKLYSSYNYMLSLVDNDINMFVERLKEHTLVQDVQVSKLQIIMQLNPADC